MDAIITFLMGFDLQSILSIVAICWFFTKDIKRDIHEIKKDIKSMDNRLTRLEGRFEERGYWESRMQHETKEN